MRTLYNAALYPARAASFVFGAWPRANPAAKLERDQRLGRRLPAVAPGGVWLHGASVGEARITAALAREIRRLRPAQAILASAITTTGRAQLPSPPLAEGAFFLPLDFIDVQRRAFDALGPAMLVLIETEIWPNLLTEAAARQIPVVIVNGRLAPERLTRYRLLAGLYRPLLRRLAAIGVADREEAARFEALGVPSPSIEVLGNLKFDLPAPTASPAAVRARFGVPADRPVVVAGSTGEGEDALVFDALATARREVPDLLLVLAPRHPARFPSAADEASRRGFRVARVSSNVPVDGADVLLVDTVGDLATLYALASSAFVGGSLVRVGGHNLLEPVAAGVPVLFGPHTGHVAEIASKLVRFAAGIRIADAPELGAAWARLATHPDERARLVASGRTVLDTHRGALTRAAQLVLLTLDRKGPGRPA